MKKTIENNSDIYLYKNFIAGNIESFNILVKKYTKQVIFFIMKYVRNYDTAEDIAQEVFIYIYTSKKDYNFQYSFKTYLFTIAKCRAINYLKSKKIDTISFDENVIKYYYQNGLDESLIKKETTEELINAIEKQKTEYKTVIYLKDFENFTYKEIAIILNKTLPQVKMLIYRARRDLMKKLRNKKEYSNTIKYTLFYYINNKYYICRDDNN